MSLLRATLEGVRDASEVLANVTTAAAILIGAVWAYWRFFRERTRWPRAALSLELTERCLDDSTVLLAVKLHVTNEGSGLMKLTELRFDLHRVRPLDLEVRSRIAAGSVRRSGSLEADWPHLDSHTCAWKKSKRPELEPGESDEFCCDFFLAPDERTVFLYAYLDNVRKGTFRRRKLGWTVTAIHDLEKASKRGRLVSLFTGGGI